MLSQNTHDVVLLIAAIPGVVVLATWLVCGLAIACSTIYERYARWNSKPKYTRR